MARSKTKLQAVPKAEEGTPLTPEQQQVQALSQQLQATRTELAVLKQMYAEVSVQARIALAEREQLLQEVQRVNQVNQTLADQLQKKNEPVAVEQPEG